MSSYMQKNTKLIIKILNYINKILGTKNKTFATYKKNHYELSNT